MTEAAVLSAVLSFPRLAATAILLAALAHRPATAAGTPDAPHVPDAERAADIATTSTAWRAPDTERPVAWTFLHGDGTVHQALQRWTREAGWQLVWEVDRDFPIDAEVTLRGTFLDALNQTMAALRDTDFPLQARVHAQSRVVRIGRYLPDGARQ